MKLKQFTQDGNLFKMKPLYGFNLILTGGLLLFAFLGYYADLPGLMWTILALAVLSFVSVSRKKLWIDINKKEIYVKSALIAPERTIPIDRIQNFELHTVSQYFIRTNASLNVYYIDQNGNEKLTGLAPGFTVSAIQNILNEIEDILANESGVG